MHVKFILPALTEARGKYWRSIKYSLFPPLGLATLAGYLKPEDTAEIVDEHVEPVRLGDSPDLVAIEVYITNASHAVFTHPKMSGETLEAGYWRSYRDFYSWRGIARSAWTKPRASGRLRHLAYVAAWKKCDPAWNLLIRLRRLHVAIPGLERVLHGWQRGPETNDPG